MVLRIYLVLLFFFGKAFGKSLSVCHSVMEAMGDQKSGQSIISKVPEVKVIFVEDIKVYQSIFFLCVAMLDFSC
jgi:hypothetical protein